MIEAEQTRSQPNVKRTAIVIAITITALIVVRLYYELIRPHTATLEIWAWQEKWPLVVMLFGAGAAAAIVAYLGRRWLPTRWCFVAAVLAAVFVTAPINGLMGIIIGGIAGCMVLIPSLARFSQTALRFGVSRIVPCALLGTATGYLLTRANYSFNAVERNSCIAGGVLLMVASAILAWYGPAILLRAGSKSVANSAKDSASSPIRLVVLRLVLIPVAAVVLVVAFVASLWLGRELNFEQRIQAIHASGGEVVFGAYRGSDLVWKGTAFVVRVELKGKDATGKHLRSLSPFADMIELSLYNASLKDDDFVVIPKLRELRTLGVYGCPISDRAVEFIAQAPRLDQLELSETRCSSRSMALVAQSISSLTIRGLSEPCRPEDLKALSRAKSIEWLNLVNIGLTDELLTHLMPLRASIYHLSLANNELTGANLNLLTQTRTATTRLRLSSLDLTGNPIELQYVPQLEPLQLYTLELGEFTDFENQSPKLEDLKPFLCMRALKSLSIPHVHVDDSLLRLLESRMDTIDVGGHRLQGRFLTNASSGVFSYTHLTIHIYDKLLSANNIARLASFDQSVVLHRCRFTPGAIAEFANHQDLWFELRDCVVEPRFMDEVEFWCSVTTSLKQD